MFKDKPAFSGFSVDDLGKAKEFYGQTLGVTVNQNPMGLELQLHGGGRVFIYEKPNHEPASFTILNFVVENIDKTVDSLVDEGVEFEQYDIEQIPQDEKGIARGLAANMGPDIAWFKDPAGNVLAVLQEK